jgi:hypothetical protein
MTEQEKDLRDIDALKTLIQFDLHSLDEILLSADKRRIIKDHLDMLISDLQPLLKRLADDIRPGSPLREP